MLAHYGSFDQVPDEVDDWDPEVRRAVRGAAKLAATLAGEREHAELFRVLATLRVDRSLLDGVSALQWQGPTEEFEDVCRRFRDPGTGRAGCGNTGRLSPRRQLRGAEDVLEFGGTGVSSCEYVHDAGSRSGRHRMNEVA